MDETTRKIRETRRLDEFDAKVEPRIIAGLKRILSKLDDSKFYPDVRKDLESYIRQWEDETGNVMVQEFLKLGKKLEEAGVIPESYDGSDVKDLEETFPTMGEVRGTVAKIDNNNP